MKINGFRDEQHVKKKELAHIDVSYLRKMYLPLLLFLAFPVNLCHGNKVKMGIIYDVSTDLFPSVTEEQAKGFSSAPPTQIYWLLMNSQSTTIGFRRVWSFIGSGIHVLISQLRCPQLTTVSAMTETLHIPHLALDSDNCRIFRNETYTIYLEHRFYYLPKMIASIGELKIWKKVIFIINNTFVQRYVQHFIQELSKAGIESVLWNGRDIKPWTERDKIIFIAKDLSRIQQMVNSTRTIPGRRSWILLFDGDVTNTDLSQMGSFLPEDSLFIITKAPCSHSQCIDCCNNTGLKELILRIESETKVIKDVCLGEFELLKSSEDLTSIQIAGKWTPTEGLLMYGYTRRPVKTDFGGIVLRVGVMATPIPISFVTVGETNSYQGFVIDILDYMAMDLNFRYVLVEPADGFYGHRLDNGSWSGVIGMVYREEIVFGAGPFTVNMERSEVVDYTIPYMDNSFSILTSKSERQTGIFQFVKPFSTKVWVLILLFGITTSVALIIMTGLAEHTHNQTPAVTDMVLDVIAAFLEQGVQSWPRSTPVRCLLVFWFVFSLLVVAIYTAHLTAVLTVSTPIKNIESLKDLSERTDLDVIVLEGGSAWTLFQSSKERVYQKIFSRMVATTAAQEEILQKVMSGKACFITGTFYSHYLVALTCRQTRIAEEHFQHQLTAFPIQKNSPFKKQIDVSLQKMMEAGLIDFLKRKWMDRPFYCSKRPNEDTTINVLNINHLWGVLLMFIGFVVLAVIYCIVERILFNADRSRTSVCLRCQ